MTEKDLIMSRWRWMTLALCLIALFVGFRLGKAAILYDSFIYIGSNEEKFHRSWIGALTE